ncbi:major paralogous domain-containing protein [Fibrobacter sp. UWCM]|uniref:FISUMP domain-containing protein n=1 Tax=Fibrobacter sp. UWCM TaxID=1896208 RepID=UPI00092450DE|nr:FISUMP domain-containing protein [Fibrobacter sp. UWCM]SHH76047.1 major paralogous domain-containing protein [Fibrobacter sp. UWCM]
MKKQLFLQVLVLAFLFVMASCGDDDSGFIARGDGSSLEDDSSDSEGDEDSADSKSGSSSSKKGSSSSGKGSSSGYSSSRSSSSSSVRSSSSVKSSSSSLASSSSIAYEDIPGKAIAGVYQGFVGHVVMPTIEVRALTSKLEYVDSTVSYAGKIDSIGYRFSVRGLPEDIEYAEIHVRVNDGTNSTIRYYVDEYAVVNLKGVDSLYVNSAMNFIYKRVKYLVREKGLSFDEAKAQAESDLRKAFYVEEAFHDLERIDVLHDETEGGYWAATIATTESISWLGNALRTDFWSDAFVTDGTLNLGDELASGLASTFYNCVGLACLGDVYSRHANRDPIRVNLIKFFDTVSGRGACTSDRAGDVFRVASDTSASGFYTCDGKEWDRSTVMDRDMYKLDFPVCGTTEKTVIGASKFEYYCNGKGTWIEARPWSVDVPVKFRLNPDIDYGTMIDPRDGQTYATVKIGNKVWMAQNLNFKGYKNKADEDSTLMANLSGGHICNSKKEAHCDVCGRLYDWAAVMNLNESMDSVTAKAMIVDPHQGICPDGWHIPSTDEFEHIITEYYSSNTDKTADMLRSRQGWGKSVPDKDPVGFSALPCGIYFNSLNMGWAFDDWGSEAYFAATPRYHLHTEITMSASFTGIGSYDNSSRHRHNSVRCVKNDD